MIDLNRPYMSTAEAEKESGLTKGYFSYLLRKGDPRVEGFRIGRDWFIYTDLLKQFLATPRKPGPKHSRTKSAAQEQQNSTPTKNSANT